MDAVTDIQRARRSAASVLVSVGCHGGLLLLAYRFVDVRAVHEPPHVELTTVQIVEPLPDPAGPPAGAGAAPSLAAIATRNTGTPAGRAAKLPSQTRPATVADMHADLVVNYDLPQGPEPGDEGEAHGSLAGTGLFGDGIGNGAGQFGSGDGIGSLQMPEPPPRPPPARSLARPPEAKYDYHDWGYFAKTTGSVLVELTIDPRGRVRNARVVRSLNAAIDKRALATARTFEFFPALNPWGEPTWGLHRWEFVIGPGGSSFLPVHRR